MTVGFLEYGLAGMVPLLLAVAFRIQSARAQRVPARVLVRPEAGAAHHPRR